MIYFVLITFLTLTYLSLLEASTDWHHIWVKFSKIVKLTFHFELLMCYASGQFSFELVASSRNQGKGNKVLVSLFLSYFMS